MNRYFQIQKIRKTTMSSHHTMPSDVGNYDTNKQWAYVEMAINRKENVQTIEVKDFDSN